MRKKFISELEKLAEKDPNVMLLTLDVGYNILEKFIERFPARYFNLGISEQNTIGVATGLAFKGKTPFVYSINSFLLFRGFEQIRMLAEMKQHVILVGVGVGKEYTNFGITHYSDGDEQALATMPIKVLTPSSKEDVTSCVNEAYCGEGPYYIRLSKF